VPIRSRWTASNAHCSTRHQPAGKCKSTDVLRAHVREAPEAPCRRPPQARRRWYRPERRNAPHPQPVGPGGSGTSPLRRRIYKKKSADMFLWIPRLRGVLKQMGRSSEGNAVPGSDPPTPAAPRRERPPPWPLPGPWKAAAAAAAAARTAARAAVPARGRSGAAGRGGSAPRDGGPEEVGWTRIIISVH